MKKRLCLKDLQGRFYLALSDIVRFEANDSYTIVHVLGGKKYIQSGTLGKFYERVKSEGIFYRIHKSHVINLLYVFSFSLCLYLVIERLKAEKERADSGTADLA